VVGLVRSLVWGADRSSAAGVGTPGQSRPCSGLPKRARVQAVCVLRRFGGKAGAGVGSCPMGRGEEGVSRVLGVAEPISERGECRECREGRTEV
jgi:hypothetical protein